MKGYAFEFSWVAEYRQIILWGIVTTVRLIVVGGAIGTGIGLTCAWLRLFGPPLLKPFGAVYVEVMRNTPLLVQLFFIFFGLPSLGIRLTAITAATVAMSLNLGAYSSEIIRAGIQATPRGQFEAAATLAMTPFETFRFVVLRPAFERIWPALCSQIVLVMLGSAVVSQISVEDLTFAGDFIQSRNFRSFETYFFITAVYFALAVIIRFLLNKSGEVWFRQKTPR